MIPIMAVLVFATALGLAPKIDGVNVGDAAPMTTTKMKTTSGDMTSIADAAMENGVIVVFSCNTCPYVIAWEDRYNEIAELGAEHGFGFIALNPNEAKRDGEDSFDAMVEHAKENDYQFAYAVDTKHEIADAYGADRTPHVFLLHRTNPDEAMKVAYIGAIDDNYKNAEEVEEPFLANAIRALAGGNNPDPNLTKSIGCTIKRID